MHEATRQLVLSCLLLLSVLTLSAASGSEYKHRIKRKVVFSKSSKFFIRLNGKDNVLNYTEIFAHGWAFRINYDLPENLPKRHQFFKRDVHNELANSTDESTQKVYSCVLKYLCESVLAMRLSDKCGIFCGIADIIARSQGMEADFFKSFFNKCDFHVNNCPFILQDSMLFSLG